MKRNNPPKRFSNLKSEKMWSLEFAQDTFPDDPFTYHILLKVTDGSYEDHGWAESATDAFQLRRELVAETGQTRYFIRAQRKQIAQRFISADGDDDAALDFYRDKFQEGVALEDIPRHLRRGYLAFQRNHGRTAR